MSASRIVHELAGFPPMDKAKSHDGPCWLCGDTMTRGIPAQKWQGANFTDQNKAHRPDATHVCEACAWCCAWVPPPGHPAPEPGKKGANLRLFTHLYDQSGGYIYCNKGDKGLIRRWLRAPKSPPWFAAIADSGQKHLLPWAPVNPAPRGTVLFEDTLIAMTGTWALLDAMHVLVDLGVPKSEIDSGEYGVRRWREQADALTHFEDRYRSMRGSRWWRLVLWLAQKGGAADDADATDHGGAQARAPVGDSPGAARTTERVPADRGERAQALGPDPKSDACGGADDDDAGGVGDADAARAPDPDDEQLPLFGDGGAK